MTPETYESVRINGKLDRTLATLDGYNQYRLERVQQGRSFRLVVSMCIQKDNWHEIEDFLKFTLERSVEPVLQFAYEPAKVSLLSLPIETRQQIISYLSKLGLQFGTSILSSIALPLQDSINSFFESTP